MDLNHALNSFNDVVGAGLDFGQSLGVLPPKTNLQPSGTTGSVSNYLPQASTLTGGESPGETSPMGFGLPTWALIAGGAALLIGVVLLIKR